MSPLPDRSRYFSLSLHYSALLRARWVTRFHVQDLKINYWVQSRRNALSVLETQTVFD